MPVLPVAGMPHPPKLRPHISSGEHREDHMAQSRKGNGHQHDLSGEIMLVAIPFTRLSHMIFSVFTRAYMGSEFGGVRHARDW